MIRVLLESHNFVKFGEAIKKKVGAKIKFINKIIRLF